MGARCFTRMDPAGQKHHFFVFESPRVTAVRKHKLIFASLHLWGDSILGANRQNFDFSPLQAIAQHISFNVNIGRACKLTLYLVKLLDRFLVAKRKSKSEVGGFKLRVAKLVLKLEHECGLLLKPITGLGNDPFPLVLHVTRDPEDGLKPLWVKFALQLYFS